MAKELYLYSPIYDFVAERLIASMEENKGEDIVIRSNTPGGSVFSGWGIIAKMKEHDGNVTIKVDGVAASMGAYMLAFADTVEVNDISRIMLHRATRYVSSPEDQALLDSINKDLEAKLTTKIDSAKLKELKGISVKDLFHAEERKDLWLTAKEAKAIGLVDKIVKLNPNEVKAFDDRFFSVAATLEPMQEKEIINPKNTVMNIEKLKAEHPALYAEVVAIGVSKEKDRTGAWLAFVDVDAEAVSKGIKEGKDLSATAMAELSRKSFSATALKKVEGDSAKPVVTAEVEGEKPADEKKKSDFLAEVKSELKK